MKATVRAAERPSAERRHPLIMGTTLVTVAIVGCAMKATAGMRGQTVHNLFEDEPRALAALSSSPITAAS